MLKWLSVLVVLVSACGCPSNSTGMDTSSKWAAERDAACAAVPGCDAEWLAQVPVYEAPIDEVRDTCDGGRGCFCVGDHCSGVIMLADSDVQLKNCPAELPNCWFTQSSTALHEYVHAALRSAGHPSTKHHPPEFEAALDRARNIFWAP